MRGAPRLLAGLAAIAFAAGCGARSCSSTADPDGGPPPPPLLPSELLPAPAPWSLAPARGSIGVALPPHCTPRLPPLRAEVAPTTRFVAPPHAPATLIVADAPGLPPRLVGVGAVTFDPSTGEAKTTDRLPWFVAETMPRLARAGDGTWLAAFDRRGAGLATRVAVWKGGEALSLGDGDRFEAVDFICSERRCALLTTRLARVAGAGAELWVGPPGEPATSWRRIEITPKEGVTDAYPSSIVRLDGAGAAPSPSPTATASSPAAPASGGAEAGAPDAAAGPSPGGILVSLVEGDDLVFYEVDEKPPAGGAHELARVATPYGVIDATTAPAPIALVFGTELDDDGCARGGLKLALARPGQKDLALDAPTPPVWASLRRLERGVLATWVAPLGCEVKRRVAFAAVLGPDGTPLSAPMAVADATAAAVSTRGGDVDLWLQQEQGSVLWIRASCGAP